MRITIDIPIKVYERARDYSEDRNDEWVAMRAIARGYTETETCDDAISRSEAIKAMDELEQEDAETYGCQIPEGFDAERAKQALRSLPPVWVRPSGEWIPNKTIKRLSNCSYCKALSTVHSDFCSHCGADMRRKRDDKR